METGLWIDGTPYMKDKVNFRMLGEVLLEKGSVEGDGRLIDVLQEFISAEEERVSIGRANVRVDINGYEGEVSLDISDFRAMIGKGRIVFTVCGVNGSVVLEVRKK